MIKGTIAIICLLVISIKASDQEGSKEIAKEIILTIEKEKSEFYKGVPLRVDQTETDKIKLAQKGLAWLICDKIGFTNKK